MTDLEFEQFIKMHFFLAPTTRMAVNKFYNEVIQHEFTHYQRVRILGYLGYIYPMVHDLDALKVSTGNLFDVLIPITDNWEDAWIDLFTNHTYDLSYVYFGNNDTIRNLSRIVK